MRQVTIFISIGIDKEPSFGYMIREGPAHIPMDASPVVVTTLTERGLAVLGHGRPASGDEKLFGQYREIEADLKALLEFRQR